MGMDKVPIFSFLMALSEMVIGSKCNTVSCCPESIFHMNSNNVIYLSILLSGEIVKDHDLEGVPRKENLNLLFLRKFEQYC